MTFSTIVMPIVLANRRETVCLCVRGRGLSFAHDLNCQSSDLRSVELN